MKCIRLIDAIERELDRLEIEWEKMQEMWTVEPSDLQRLASVIEAARARLVALRGGASG